MAPPYRPAGFTLRPPAPRPSSMPALLTRRLGDLLAIQDQCRDAHWDLAGPDLASVRRSLFVLWGSMEKYGDLLAGRVAQLGGAAPVSGRRPVGGSVLDDASLRPCGVEEEHLTSLRRSLEATGIRFRSAIRTAREIGDMESAVICHDVARAVTASRRIVAARLDERGRGCR